MSYGKCSNGEKGRNKKSGIGFAAMENHVTSNFVRAMAHTVNVYPLSNYTIGAKTDQLGKVGKYIHYILECFKFQNLAFHMKECVAAAHPLN